MVRICDLGCFTQDGKDTNKYYHAAVVQHRSTKKWYAYLSGDGTGAARPSFQFVECSGEQDAAANFASQLHSKNDRRGQWVTVAGIRTLRAKPGNDCYLVRPMATRSTGLPDARSIKINEGAKPKPAPVTADDDEQTEATNGKPAKKGAAKKKSIEVDPQTRDLLRDLSVATIAYTRGSMADRQLAYPSGDR